MEEYVVSDRMSGIGPVGPTYPVKPLQPSQKDREPGKRQNKGRRKPEPDERRDDDKPTIDEHV